MDLVDLIADMAMRFINVEKNQYPQINSLNAQIQAVNNNYEVLKTKSRALVPNLILFFVLYPIIIYGFPVLAIKIFPMEQGQIAQEAAGTYIALAVVLLLAPIILIILNTIRIKLKNKKRLAEANEWWERVGRAQIVELNQQLDAVRIQVYEYLSANQLYELFSARGWANSRDCGRVYDLTVRYNLGSIQQAFAVYEDVLEREYEREEDRYQQQQILDAIEAGNQYQAELVEQGRRAEVDRSIIELQLFEMKNRH